MAESKGLDIPEIYSLRQLAEKSKINYTKLYHSTRGTYNSLSENDRSRLYNVLFQGFEDAAIALGFTADGNRIKKI